MLILAFQAECTTLDRLTPAQSGFTMLDVDLRCDPLALALVYDQGQVGPEGPDGERHLVLARRQPPGLGVVGDDLTGVEVLDLVSEDQTAGWLNDARYDLLDVEVVLPLRVAVIRPVVVKLQVVPASHSARVRLRDRIVAALGPVRRRIVATTDVQKEPGGVGDLATARTGGMTCFAHDDRAAGVRAVSPPEARAGKVNRRVTAVSLGVDDLVAPVLRVCGQATTARVTPANGQLDDLAITEVGSCGVDDRAITVDSSGLDVER